MSPLTENPLSKEPAIRTSELTKRFAALEAVDRLDLEIPSGQIFGLLGPNGAGKSTTIKMLTTLLDATSGSASVAGFDVAREPIEVRRRIGYVPQMVSADGALTGRENLILSARLYGMSGPRRKEQVAKALRFMELEPFADKLVRQYSGGMIRRLEIAQAFLHGPAVLFLDEPTIGLDPMARAAVWERLKELRRELGLTVLITTHDMDEADALCDRLGLMHRGKLVVCGKPAELKARIGPEAELDEVFARFCGGSIHEGGDYRDVSRTRRTARRLG